MTGKMKLYIGLLVLGLLMVGGGLWFLLNTPPRIDIPEGEPVIAMNITNFSVGTASQLAIYENGTVIYRENKGFRRGWEDYPPTSTWRVGNLREEEMDSLIDFLRRSRFDELDTYYQSSGSHGEAGGMWGETVFIVSFNYGDLHKTVRALGYLTPIGSMAPPDMPYPLDEIHKKLMDIVGNKTEEVYRETF